jgi:hypothetical protein
LALIDEVYIEAHTPGSPRIVSISSARNSIEILVDMDPSDIGSVIGYEGGQFGASLGYLSVSQVFLVLRNGNNVITAYPVSPSY